MTAEIKAATTESSPWEQATLFINGKKVEWGAELVLLRGQQNEVTVEAPPALARTLNLGLAEAGSLNIVASPKFGEWVVPVVGKFNWKITPDAGKSGRITLVFFSREELVPWEHRSLVISSNLADEADVEIGGVAVPAGGNWFFREKAQTVTLTPKPNSPLAGLPVTLTCTIKSGLEVDNVVSTPAFGSEQTAYYSWRVTGKTKSGTFELKLSGKGMTTPITLPISKLLSNHLADEAVVNIGGVAVPDGGNWFIRNQAQIVTLRPKSDSPLAGLPVTLTCTIKSNLSPANVVSAPGFGSEQTLHSWRVTGNTNSGTFELKLSGKGMITPITLPISKLLSNNLADEANVKIDGVAVPAEGNWFFRDKPQTVTLTPKPGSLLAGLPVSLTCAVKGGLSPANLASSPAFGSEQTGYRWDVVGKTKSGTFELKLSGKGMTTPITLPISKLLSNNLADEVNVMMDGKEISNVDIPNLRREWHTFTLVPKLYSPLAGYPLRLQWIKGDGIESGDLGFRPQINAESVVYSWQVTGSFTKAGSYELGFAGSGFSEMLVLPVIRQIVPKYYVDGKELLDLTDFILPDRPYSLSVEVSAGISSIYVKNSSGEFIFNPPLNRSFPVTNGRVEWTFSSPAAGNVLETVVFDYSSVYTAREEVLLFSRAY
ncbi:hypothetical protein [Pseudomonas sp. GL-RE-19]|uniref:hypothetical protein n=1 Tax=Pseudomonas sp. GL-RE-19 TaxID=2832389 RepID=UPI001CBCBE3D|nr:hypothetical protein [Pseudomonas sp. GL-RE-19]